MHGNITKVLSLVAAISLAGTGCLKDKDYDDGLIQSVRATGGAIKVVEIKLDAASQENFHNFFVDNSNNDTTVDLIPVNLATNEPAPTDLHVTLTANDSLITAYNDSNQTEYVVPTKFTVVNPVVTIPKGSHTGYMQIKFKPSDFVGTTAYAVGYTITKIDEAGYVISGNAQNGIVTIGIKNKYDGLYSLVVRSVGWQDYDILNDEARLWPSNAIILSSGANSVFLNTAEAGSSIPVFTAEGGLTGFGNTQVELVFDPATDKIVDAHNTFPDDGRGRFVNLNTAEDSYYDPATKTIYAAYILKQNGRPNQMLYDTLVYQQPR